MSEQQVQYQQKYGGHHHKQYQINPPHQVGHASVSEQLNPLHHLGNHAHQLDRPIQNEHNYIHHKDEHPHQEKKGSHPQPPHEKQELHPKHNKHHQEHHGKQNHQLMDVEGDHYHENAHKLYDYNSFKTDDGNEVWAGALALAWKDMAKLAGKKYLRVHADEAGKKAADNYNYGPFSEHDLKPESRYTKSGFGQFTVDQINHQREKHFPECTFPPLDISLPPEGAISYSYIYKKLTYAFRFERRKQNLLKFTCANGQVKEVPSFYAEDERQYDQIKVYDYNDNDDFILRLMTNDDNEEIFAYKVGPNVTLKEVIKKIEEISKKTEDIYSVGEVESFEFPILDFDYSRSVDALVGAELSDLGGRKIEAIIQGVKLKLDETGVVVENQGMMFTDECGVFNPRIMRIDSPFWLVMKERDRHPYLCIRVNNL